MLDHLPEISVRSKKSEIYCHFRREVSSPPDWVARAQTHNWVNWNWPRSPEPEPEPGNGSSHLNNQPIARRLIRVSADQINTSEGLIKESEE